MLFGTHTTRKLKQYQKVLHAVNLLEPQFKKKSDEEIRVAVDDFRKRALQGENLDDLLPEVFCCVRVAAERTLDQRHFDVQIIGGIALHGGQIAEMKTGEGKTLTATLPVVLNAVTGRGVHLVTVNDYLAKRDKEWMQPIYEFLGISVGIIQHGLNDTERKNEYGKDVTYGTNSEFGFDYLRDNMKFNVESLVQQRGYYYAIVDEVDSILIDEARTPLIISGATDESTDKYRTINDALHGLVRGFRLSDNPDPQRICQIYNIKPDAIDAFFQNHKDSDLLIDGDFVLDEKSKNIQLTDQGSKKVEQNLSSTLTSDSLYDIENIESLHHVNQALKARYVFRSEVDYVVKDNRVIIVDEFTGRLMEGRRYSDGLHQALEAKENLQIEKENRTLATITYQNFFRKYQKLAGMTGTAETEEEEFIKIYNLGVFVTPTNKPIVRNDHPDAIYKTKTAKNKAIINKIGELYHKGQPVLVGTDSIEYSEYMSSLLKKKNIPHNVLNAKYFEKEAEIIADAGNVKGVTIATNMAGRGTDIKLTESTKNSGGLYILGTVRHESRRIDNQLRGRSGRQGDPGESKYYISLDDDLLRIFGGERIARVMTTLKIDEDEAIEHPLISRAIENSQKNVESRHFSVRKHLLEYDDVINRQREIIYTKRQNILFGRQTEIIGELSLNIVHDLFDGHCASKHSDEWNADLIKKELNEIFFFAHVSLEQDKSKTEWVDAAISEITKGYENKKQEFGELNDTVEKHIFLDTLDHHWKEHLINLDYLKESVGLSGYAQKNPLDEYKKEAFYMFSSLMDTLERQTVTVYFKTHVQKESPAFAEKKERQKLTYGDTGSTESAKNIKKQPVKKLTTLGRNALCSCGSGKKYKFCCINK